MKDGFTAIGIGIMCLCILFGMSQCIKSTHVKNL